MPAMGTRNIDEARNSLWKILTGLLYFSRKLPAGANGIARYLAASAILSDLRTEILA
jgi:hypothetical protein